MSLALDRAELRAAGATPLFLTKLDESVYRYFRALAVEYSSRVCHDGLEDYDQAGFGPAIVDLVRFASSLHLACREVTWPCHADRAVLAFFREYRASLAAAPVRVPPALVDPGAPEFWLKSWEPGYAELSISDIESQADLEELAVDAARQLAGHFWTRFPEPLRPAQRFAQLQAFDASEQRARGLAKGLADETFTSRQRFRAAR